MALSSLPMPVGGIIACATLTRSDLASALPASAGPLAAGKSARANAAIRVFTPPDLTPPGPIDQIVHAVL
jgi:hypothetical protein